MDLTLSGSGRKRAGLGLCLTAWVWACLSFMGVVAACLAVSPARAADWPAWRHDSERSAVTAEQLPAEMHVQWVRQLREPQPAWPEQPDDKGKLQFDVSYSPVVMGRTLFVASMTLDCLAAYDTATGEERWRYYAEGPVRLAPAAWRDLVFFVSDDGYLYCLKAKDGALVWKFRGGPSHRLVLGNDRLISMWPARSGPLVKDGVVYFTAGLWPFMGIFVHALDAETGRLVWTNSGTGSTYTKQQHDAFSFAGVSPQGYMAASADALLVPGGRTPPMVLDAKTGAMRFLDLANRALGNASGGYSVRVLGEWYFDGSGMYRLADGTPLLAMKPGVLSDGEAVVVEGKRLAAYGGELAVEETEKKTSRGVPYISRKYSLPVQWRAEAGVPITSLFLQAGTRLYASGPEGRVLAIEPPREGGPAALAWQGRVEGEPWDMLAADGRLFVVTRQGAIYCFGEDDGTPRYHALEATKPPKADVWQTRAADMLNRSGATGGYCIVWGAGTGRLAEELARQSTMHVVVVEPDAKKVAALRRRIADAGVYGTRLAVLTGDPSAMVFPPYVAELVTSEAAPEFTRAMAENLFQPLRPYGGAVCLPLTDAQHAEFAASVAEAGLANAEMTREGGVTVLTRAGALPGAADWTHQYADAANTVFSPDTSVRAPLGVLWFGSSSNENVLPRHGHGPSPQVVGGRVLLMGAETLAARDVYTGRPLWEVGLSGVGKPYDNTAHQPGANALGSNFASATDAIYVHRGRSCLRLDPATGKTVAVFRLPADPLPAGVVVADDAVLGPPAVSYVAVWEDLLIATVEPQTFDRAATFLTGATSKRLAVLNRATGEVLWSRDARYGFRHNAIVAGGGNLYFIDRLPPTVLEVLGVTSEEAAAAEAQIVAVDIRTGEETWKKTEGIFGTWLGYSAAHDTLVESGRPSADMIEGEVGDRIVALRGRGGDVVWDKMVKYQGPLILHGDRIISSARGGGMFSLLTGDALNRTHPLTGQEVPWTYSRQYGCGSVLASEHLLTFRSGAAGYFDLERGTGTGNLGGFKSGCTSNLVVADGVLNAPDYTRTCTCSYQLQTSLALVPMEDVENWTWSTDTLDLETDGPVRRVGVNFGAPGDRMDDGGTLWLDYPSVGGPSPNIPVSAGPAEAARWFRKHTSVAGGEGPAWVAASGVVGATSITLTLAGSYAEGGAVPAGERSYTVRLVFSEPEGKVPGQRVFSVALQGREVLKDFDAALAAGGADRAVVREFKGVKVARSLHVMLTPSPAAAGDAQPVLCGVAVAVEE